MVRRRRRRRRHGRTEVVAASPGSAARLCRDGAGRSWLLCCRSSRGWVGHACGAVVVRFNEDARVRVSSICGKGSSSSSTKFEKKERKGREVWYTVNNEGKRRRLCVLVRSSRPGTDADGGRFEKVGPGPRVPCRAEGRLSAEVRDCILLPHHRSKLCILQPRCAIVNK